MRHGIMVVRALRSALLFASLTGCVFHRHAEKYHGALGPRGVPCEYQQSSVWALHFVWNVALIGDANLESAVDQFTAEAARRGATRIDVTYTDKYVYWFLFPPLTFLVHPVDTTVEGTVEGTVGPTGNTH
jgi:hypothetical protein